MHVALLHVSVKPSKGVHQRQVSQRWDATVLRTASIPRVSWGWGAMVLQHPFTRSLGVGRHGITASIHQVSWGWGVTVLQHPFIRDGKTRLTEYHSKEILRFQYACIRVSAFVNVEDRNRTSFFGRLIGIPHLIRLKLNLYHNIGVYVQIIAP